VPIVVTLDTYLLGWRERDLAARLAPFFARPGNGQFRERTRYSGLAAGAAGTRPTGIRPPASLR